MTEPRPLSGVVGRRSLIVGAVGLLTLSACSTGAAKESENEPRTLTAQEAELLALARVRLHRAKTVPVAMKWPGEPSSELDVTLDLHQSVGWGTIRSGPDTERLILWNLNEVATAPAAAKVSALDAWATRSVSTSVPQDIFLILALTLGSDRPENPVLLQQGSARFLRRDTVEGTAVAVLEGPRPAEETEARKARSRYWIADDGELLRFEAFLGARSGEFASLTVTAPHDQVAGLREQAGKVLNAPVR